MSFVPLGWCDADSLGGEWTAFFALPRTGHSAIYDPATDRMIAAAGFNAYTNPAFYTDVWAFPLATPSNWTEIAAFTDPLDGRWGHSAILDPARHRMIIFGGRSLACACNDTWILDLDPPFTLTKLEFPAPLPRGGWGHSAIYEPEGDRMIVFGGSAGPSTYWNDVWALELAGEPEWVQLLPAGTPPSPRAEHVAVYDPVRKRMIVLGGDYTAPNDVWSLSLDSVPTWTQLAPQNTNPTDYYEHAAVYDPVRDRLLVVGRASNQTWALSLDDSLQWSQVPALNTSGIGRPELTAIYDPVRDRLVLYGGGGYGATRDVNALPLSGDLTWTKLSPLSAWPSARALHAAAFDASRNRVLLFGGEGTTDLSDTWALTLDDAPVWSALATMGTPPSPRHGHSAIVDNAGDRLVVFGGSSGATRMNDTWVLNLQGVPTWSQVVSSTSPAPRTQHAAVYDPARQCMLVFGGYDGTTHRDDLWKLSLDSTPEWSEIVSSGSWPAGRSQHAMAHDPIGDRTILFAGWGGGSTWFNDTWELTLGPSPSWNQLAPEGGPPAFRRGHSMIFDADRNRMLVFSGTGGGTSRYLDLWSLSLDSFGHWTSLAPAHIGPTARKWHTATYSPDRGAMVVFGGDPRNDETWYLSWPVATPVDGDGPIASQDFFLSLPEPNPSKQLTRLRYRVSSPGPLRLDLFDVSGRRVRTLRGTAADLGDHEIVWDGRDDSGKPVASGLYFARFQGPDGSAHRAIVRF